MEEKDLQKLMEYHSLLESRSIVGKYYSETSKSAYSFDIKELEDFFPELTQHKNQRRKNDTN